MRRTRNIALTAVLTALLSLTCASAMAENRTFDTACGKTVTMTEDSIGTDPEHTYRDDAGLKFVRQLNFEGYDYFFVVSGIGVITAFIVTEDGAWPFAIENCGQSGIDAASLEIIKDGTTLRYRCQGQGFKLKPIVQK